MTLPVFHVNLPSDRRKPVKPVTSGEQKMKPSRIPAALALGIALVLSSPALAQTFPSLTQTYDSHPVIATVVDSYPIYSADSGKKVRSCKNVRVPIYRKPPPDQQAGNVIAGAIIGGTIGQIVTGNKNGATAGAVIGGIAGANKNKKHVVGYKTVRRCSTTKRKGAKHLLYYESQVRIDGQIYTIHTANSFDPGDRVRLYMPN